MKKRKIIATALMAGLVLSSSSTYAADLTGFKDAPQVGSSAYESLNYAVEKGYLAGIDGELKAEKTLTRAELAAIVVRAYGKDAVASNLSQFKDVKKDAWYYEELAKAYSKGYIKGKSATMMAPNETVSQLEALVIIARASGHTSGSQADLAGISEKVPSWAVSSIGSLVKAGVIKADGNGKLNLSAKMTRGNFAGAVYKADKSIDNRTQEDNAKNAKKGDTNNPLDKNGKNPYLPAPGSSSSGGGGGSTPTPQPQTKADKFKAEMGNVPTLRTSIETDKFELEVEEKSKITADRISKALDTEGKKQTYGYIDVSIKTNVDRSSVGQKEAVASLKFNDNSELEVKIPVEVEGLPVAYIHSSVKLGNALKGKEFAVGDNLDLSDMKVLVPFAKQLKEDGTWDETSAQAVYVAYKDLGIADIKVVKKGTTTEFVNNSPITADMVEDGKIALEVYKENIVSKDPEAAHRQPIKGLKAKATTPQPQTKADKFKAEMGNVPTLRTSIVTDKLVLEVEEKSKITADRVSKALDTEGKRPTYGYIDVSIKTDVDRSSVGQKEAVATLKFNDNSELEVKIPVEVEGLPVVYLHPSIKLSSALSGKEYEVGENLDLNGMKVLVPFAKELKADGTWDETAAAQLVYVEYKDLGVADIKVVKKGTTTEFVNNSPITADMIEDGKIALEVYKENIVSKDPEAAHRQPIKGLKAKATAPNPPAPGGSTNPLFGEIDGKNILSKAQVEAISQNLHFEDGEFFGDTVGFVESKPLPVKITVTNGKVVAVDIVRDEIGKIWPGSYPGNAVDDGGKFEASCIRAFNLVASKGKDPIVLAYQMKAARDLTRQTLAVSSDTGKEISEALIDIVGKNKFGANNNITVRSHYDVPSDAEDDVMRCMKTYLTTDYGYEQYNFDTISGATFSGAGGAVAIGNALKKATADSDIKDFRVKTFATDKSYMVGDEADWSDVVVTVTKKDGSAVDVPYAQFSDYGLSIVIKANQGYHKYLPFPQGEHFDKVGAIYPRVYHQASETYKFLKAMNVTAKRKIMKGEKIQIKVKGTDNWIDLLDYQTDEYVQRLKVPTAEVSNIDGKEVEFREVAKDIRSGEVKEFSLKLASTPDASIIAKVDGSEQYEVVIPQSELKVTPPYSINPNNHRIILSAE